MKNMGLWNNLFRGWGKPEPAPAWARFFNDEQFGAFKHLIDEHFRARNQKIEWGDGALILRQPEGMQQLGLTNLAQLCARNDGDEWKQIVDDHFRTLEKSQSEQRVLEDRLTDFARVSELLAVRLWPDKFLGDLDTSKMIQRHDLPGTISALVYDLPSSIRNVTPDEVAGWGRDPDELFRIALANIRETCIPDVSQQSLGDDIDVFVLSDESFFVASHALILEDHPNCIGPFGTLIGVPHRHVLLAYPIENIQVVDAIPRMIAVIAGMEREGPGSISSRIYWHQHGEFFDLPYRVDDNTLHFMPPESFLEMLQLLSDNGDDDEDDDDEES